MLIYATDDATRRYLADFVPSAMAAFVPEAEGVHRAVQPTTPHHGTPVAEIPAQEGVQRRGSGIGTSGG
ncbi:hypothetical protein [Micromonospora sp. NPDC049645]|uniref:hypothetical protein n=1 Tax=Micromonospora sp. NPDC049645 TaxID=3155508 RepID=UPI0034203433